jgi:hypothetical protein
MPVAIAVTRGEAEALGRRQALHWRLVLVAHLVETREGARTWLSSLIGRRRLASRSMEANARSGRSPRLAVGVGVLCD